MWSLISMISESFLEWSPWLLSTKSCRHFSHLCNSLGALVYFRFCFICFSASPCFILYFFNLIFCWHYSFLFSLFTHIVLTILLVSLINLYVIFIFWRADTCLTVSNYNLWQIAAYLIRMGVWVKIAFYSRILSIIFFP